MSTCAQCRRFHVELVQPGVRSAPYNCDEYRTIVSPGAKACAKFDPRVRKPIADPPLWGDGVSDFRDDFVTILHGDAWQLAPTLEPQSVNTIVTSPPYWGLRDYGVPGQFGLESTPEAYVVRLVALFALLRLALRDDGTVWLNLGDSYAANRSYQVTDNKHIPVGNDMASNVPRGLKPKDLVGIPWRVAFALQADGWYLRSDIIWHKPNPMPESVTDRPTKAHEYVFLLSKSPRYYYDAEAIKEDGAGPSAVTGGDYVPPGQTPHSNARVTDKQRGHGRRHAGFNARWDGMTRDEQTALGRNKRSVWTVATQPFAAAHFATFPPALITPCILAGCPERCCPTCGAPWERLVERGGVIVPGSLRQARRDDGSPVTGDNMINPGVRGSFNAGGSATRRTAAGWMPTCDHGSEPVPGTVLDPFMGSGTTAAVARSLGRKAIGFELNADYIAIAARHRLAQGVLL